MYTTKEWVRVLSDNHISNSSGVTNVFNTYSKETSKFPSKWRQRPWKHRNLFFHEPNAPLELPLPLESSNISTSV